MNNDKNANIINIDLQDLDNEYLLDYHSLHKYVNVKQLSIFDL